MCGIVGYVGCKNALHVIINGLERLEYRGYDSAGIAFKTDNKVNIIKKQGRIENLKKSLDFNDNIDIGIGHTRWATHGEANSINSHPHRIGNITLVHNGIIENYGNLKQELIGYGYNFKTDTDTEIAAGLLDYLYNKNKKDISITIQEFIKEAKGSYALGIIFDDDDSLYAVKKDSPLIVAFGENENYIASDVPAILKYTKKYVPLNDLEYVKLDKNKVLFFDRDGNEIKKEIKEFTGESNDVLKNGYDHYMEKEIYEQPGVMKKTISDYNTYEKLMKNMPTFSNYEEIQIVACGSAMHTGLIGKNFIEELAETPTTVEVASEYRYKKLFLNENKLVIIISQSGETADSLAALKIAKEKGATTLGIINVVESTIARGSDMVIYTKAGTEIAVATTKAYSSQVAILSLIALKIAAEKGLVNEHEVNDILSSTNDLESIMEKILSNRKQYREIAKTIYEHNDVFFIGRGVDNSLCMEGSLKLKEISYINSQSYPAGELKHGTISLINKGTPVIAITTDEKLVDKTVSNIKEVRSRGARVILLTTDQLDLKDDFYDEKIVIPKVNNLFQTLVTIIPLQLLAYEIAKLRGCDIDKPKNLAKSVTVE